MKKFMKLLLSAMMALSILGASAPVALASHEASMFVVSGFTANAEHWINLLTPDFSACATGPLSYPANTLFFVSLGWGDAPWKTALPAEKQGFMSETTRFTFVIDGQLQMQSRVYHYDKGPDPLFGIPDLMSKLYNTEYHNGLTGSRLFTGQFFLDASLLGGSFGEAVLVLECSVVVNFTG